MIKFIVLSFVVFLCNTSHSMMGPYPHAYYNPGRGYFSPPAGFVSAAPSSGCSAKSCQTMSGFKQCLEDPTSPYRMFAFHPERIKTDGRALAQLRKFRSLYPDCYRQFCNRVCATVPKQFREVDPIAEKANWLSRQKDWFYQNERWKGREHQKRLETEMMMKSLCGGEGVLSIEARFLCSQCMYSLKGDREIIKACSIPNLHFKQTKRPQRRNRNEDWGSHAFERSSAEADQELEPVLDIDREKPAAAGEGPPQPKAKSEQRRERERQEMREERGSKKDSRLGENEEDMSDTDSQESGSSQGSTSSSPSQQASPSAQLTAEALAQLPQGRPSPAQWAQQVRESRGQSDSPQAPPPNKKMVLQIEFPN